MFWGNLVRKWRWTTRFLSCSMRKRFTTSSDRLVFHVRIPPVVYLNIYRILCSITRTQRRLTHSLRCLTPVTAAPSTRYQRHLGSHTAPSIQRGHDQNEPSDSTPETPVYTCLCLQVSRTTLPYTDTTNTLILSSQRAALSAYSYRSLLISTVIKQIYSRLRIPITFNHERVLTLAAQKETRHGSTGLISLVL